MVGYLSLALGIGEAGRQVTRTLQHSGAHVRGLPITLNSNSQPIQTGFEPLFVERAGTPVELYSVNADQLPQVIAHLGDRVSSNAYRIMMPFWELEKFPREWCAAFDLVDEIWAPTRFIQAAVARATDKPIRHMPLLLEFSGVTSAADTGKKTGTATETARGRFALPADKFLFLFAFDFFSFIDRKNPLGAVEAFRRAFGGRNDVAFVIKTQNFERQGNARDLHDLIDDDRNFIHIDRTLDRDDMLHLLDACDAVVSLHRSEGLGLLIAEAMAAGKPVVATDYSASTDLISMRTGWPVDYQLMPVGDGQYPFHQNQVWAEPDLGHAAWQMRQVVDDAVEREKRVQAARAHLLRRHGLAACSARAAKRLRHIAKFHASPRTGVSV